MATLNTNISKADVSKFLKGKSLKNSTKNFLKKCAKGESDVALFKSCTGMAAKSIDTMYVMVGVVILGIKNKSNINVKGTLREAKLTLRKFCRLLYAGDGQKIYSYLENSGWWFRDLISALLTADEDICERFYKKIKSIKMASKVIRKLFSKSLENLKGLILAVCPGLGGVLEQSYRREAKTDNREKENERAILECLARVRSEDGEKIPANLRHRIVVHVYSDGSPVWEKLSGKLIWESNVGDEKKLLYHIYYNDRLLKDAAKNSKDPLIFALKETTALNGNEPQEIALAILQQFKDCGLLTKSAGKLRAEMDVATFNKNITASIVSKCLRGTSLKSGTKKFLKKCANGEVNEDLFKSCVSAAKPIDTMYIVVGVVILGVKNRSNADVADALRRAKSTLNKFFRLLCAGDGQEIHSYLSDYGASGGWLRGIISALITADGDKDVYERFCNKIKSINMTSEAIRKWFSKSLENLENLILEICPGLKGVLDWSYQREGDTDSSYTKSEERLILECLARLRVDDGELKIPSIIRNRIVVEVYRSDDSVWQKLSDNLSFITEVRNYSLYFRGKSFENAVKNSTEPLIFIVKLHHDVIMKSDRFDIAEAIFLLFMHYGLLKKSSAVLRAEDEAQKR